jgi:HEAT repeat protein
MYNFSQRFTALLLLFSITLQSCYTPLKMSYKKSASTLKVSFNSGKSGKPFSSNDSTSLEAVQSEIDWLQDEEHGDTVDNRAKEKQVIKYEKTESQESPASSQIISEGSKSQEELPTVSFYQKDGLWKAKVEETSGFLQRSEDLDVVCSPGMDVKALNHMSKAQSKQLIHRVKHPKKDFIYLGKMGLRGGMFGNVSDRTSKMEEKDIPSSSRRGLVNVIGRTAEEKTIEKKEEKARELSTSPQRRPSRETVQGLIEQRDDLQDTESIVKAFNNSSGLEMIALQRWLEGYIDWFTAQPIENLRETDLEEYSSLADIQPKTQEHKSLVQRYLFSLVNKIESNTHGRIPVIRTLYYSLMSVNKDVFEENPTFLIQLGNDLLDKLNSEKAVFTKSTYPSYQPLLYALHQTLVLIQVIAPCQWRTSKESDEDKRVALYYHFKEKLEAIKDNGEAYYPFVYHSMVLLQSLSRLENKKGLCQKENINRLYKGDQGRCYIDKVIGSLLTLDVDTYSLETSYESLRVALEKKRVEAKDWYDLLQVINQAAFLSLTSDNETNTENFYCLFKNDIKQLLTVTKTDQIQAFFFPDLNKILLDNEEAERALHYGIVGQLRELALESPLAMIRLECLLQLESLTQTENWAEDAELMEELLDSLAMIAKQRQKERQLESSKAKDILETLRNSIPQEATKRGRNRINLTPSQQTIKDWLGKATLEEKLEEKEEAKIAQDLGRVYSKVSESLGLAMPMAQAEARQLLQIYYQDKFAYIHKLFEDEAPQFIATAQYQLMVLEQKPVKEEKEGNQERKNEDQIAIDQQRMQLVKIPINLEDLFKARSKQEGGPLQEVRKVLLVGNPGTGKTTVSRQLAYLWANGQGDQSFQNVYVIPVRALQQTEYDGRSLRRASNLATAIANLCFGNIENDEDYNSLRLRINASLKNSNTLVVLDGLDERLGSSETLIEEAQEGNHKLLMLSRPYGLGDLCKGIDLEVEHAGFNQAQVENYVQNYFGSNKANKDANADNLLKFLEQYPSLSNIAHVPVNLCILCSLWKQNSGELEKVKGSLTKLYEGLTEHLWQRYADKYNEKRSASNKLQNKHKKDLFDTLGDIALHGLEKGEVLISFRTIDKVLKGVEENELMLDMLKRSGLLEKIGMEYHFPHLTFQEYFASKALAKLVVSEKPVEQAKAKEFLRAHKYQSQYRVVLSFLAGEISQLQGESGIANLLRMINERPKDIIGLHQLILELRCLNEYLLLYSKLPDAIEKEFECMARLRKWIQQGLEEVFRYGQLLEFLTGALQDMPAVAREAQDVLKTLISVAGDKDKEEYVRYLAIRALGELVEAAPEHAQEILSNLPLSVTNESLISPACVIALSKLAKVVPEYVLKILPTLRISSDWVRFSAIRRAEIALCKASTEYAQKVLPTLISGAKDKERGFRYAAIHQLRELAQASQNHGSAILPIFLEAVFDKEKDVSSVAIVALGELMKAAPEHAQKIFPTLLSAAGDKDLQFRSAAIRALGELVKAAPVRAREIFPTLISAAVNKEKYVCSAAIVALGELVKVAPEHAQEILPPLLSAAVDKDLQIRSAAIVALGELVKVAPEHAQEMLSMLIISTLHKDSYVLYVAIRALGELVKVAPEHAQEMLSMLIISTLHKDSYVRSAAIRALGDLVKAAPGYAQQVLPTLLIAAKSREWGVSSAASSALVYIVKAAPKHAVEVLETVLSAVKVHCDYGNVIEEGALRELVKAAPEHAQEILPILLSAVEDKEWSVREAAIVALGELIKVAPEHALAILQILLSPDKDNFAAIGALDSLPLATLMQFYFPNQDEKLLSVIIKKVWNCPIVAQYSKKGYQQLVSYSTAGAPEVLGEYPTTEVQKFVKQVLKQVNDEQKE